MTLELILNKTGTGCVYYYVGTQILLKIIRNRNCHRHITSVFKGFQSGLIFLETFNDNQGNFMNKQLMCLEQVFFCGF